MTPACRPPAGPALWGPPLAFLGAALAVWAMDWNTPLFLWLNHLGGGDPVWGGVTLFGEPLTILALGLVCYLRRPQAGWSLILGGLVAALVVNGLKELLGLPRPLSVLPPETVQVVGQALHWRAMPSGHTATAFLFAAVVFWCADLRPLKAATLALAILAGLSRVMVGAHWPLDVLAGAALGWLLGALGVWMATRLPALYRPAGLRLGGAILAFAAVALFFYPSGYPETLALQRAVAVAVLVLAGFFLWHRRRA